MRLQHVPSVLGMRLQAVVVHSGLGMRLQAVVVHSGLGMRLQHFLSDHNSFSPQI